MALGCGLVSRQTASLFKLQQQALAPQPATVTGECAVLAYHAMTRNEDADLIHAIGPRHRPLGRTLANAAGEFVVRYCLAVWDALQFRPDFVLKRRTSSGEP